MRIEKIAYEQLYPTGVYANQRYRVEMTIEETDWGYIDTPSTQEGAVQLAFTKAKDIVEKTFLSLNPQINWDGQNRYGNGIPTYPESWLSPPELTSGKNGSQPTITQVEQKLAVTVEDINSCTDKVVLDSYKFLVRNNPELEKAFLKKMETFLQSKKITHE